MRQTAFFFLLLFIQTGVSAQTTDYRKQQNYKEWVHLAPKFNDAFFRTEEAQRIGDNVLLYQQVTGGWPKNIYMPAELTEQEYTKAWNAKGDVNQSTIDNNATTTEIQYLARLYQATQKEKYKEGVLKGIQYLLKAQYDNGGWPQFYPRPTGYYIQITYNDNAMVRVMQQLREIYEKQSPYTFIPDETCQQARKAFDKGIECILRTQVRQNGELTVWCAQHDRITLEPCKARAYELPSLSGQESDNIVLLLMSLPHPSEKVIESIESAVKWFKKSEIKGIQKEYFTNSDGKRDYQMIVCNAIRTQLPRLTITNPIIIHYNFYEPDKQRDKGNIFSFADKAFQDALQKCGVIKNDGWKEIDNFTHDFYVDKKNPRIEIFLEEIEKGPFDG